MIRAPKRTWMKVTFRDDDVMWVGVEYDSIVEVRNAIFDAIWVGGRADDTLSQLRAMNCGIEGPFDEPE